MTRALIAASALAVVAMVASGCGKREGGSCRGTESTCIDKRTALACHAGKWAKVSCGGPAGCAKYQGHASCDTSVASTGAPCMGEDDEYACSPERKRALVCKGGRFELYLECRGKDGCASEGHRVSCDTSIARAGDPCNAEGARACDEERRHLLTCGKDRRFSLHRYCRGKRGCAEAADTTTCDESIALAGDPCGVPGQAACALDGRSEVVCEGGVFTRSRSCKTACTVTDRPDRRIECK